ncbi:MAG: molybdenum ABC transporter ATP-binding protein [Pseudomonadota bacterium]
MSAKVLTVDAALMRGDFRLTIDATVPLDGCTALFGPSGSGKTTLLRLIAGFDRPNRGRIALGSTPWCDTATRTSVAPHRRGVGFVFQETRLFDHLSVAGNLAYADRRSAQSAAGYTFDDVVAGCELERLLDRRPASLSGGERQRASLARMLLARPELALLDEPLSALDQRRRLELGGLIGTLPERFGVPVLFVSHDVDEICRLADHVVVLADGKVSAIGRTGDVLNAAEFAATRDDPGVVLDGTVTDIDTRLRLVTVDAGGSTLKLPLIGPVSAGTHVRVRFRARDLAIATQAPTALSIRNVIAGDITAIDADGESAFVTIRLAVQGGVLAARITRAAVEALELTVGQHAYALVKSASLE